MLQTQSDPVARRGRRAVGGGWVEYRVLGKLEVVRDGHPVDLGAFRQRALLALLLTAPNSVFSTDRILDELWGAEGGIDKQNALWVYVSGTAQGARAGSREAHGGHDPAHPSPGLPHRGRSARRSTRSASSGWSARDGRWPTSIRRRRRSCSVRRWRCGGAAPFEDFTYESFAQAEIARLEELRLEAVELRVDADLAAGPRARADLGVGVARPSASAARNDCRPADARAVSIVAAGRRAAGVPAAQVAAGRGARDRAVVVASQARGADRHRRRGARDPQPGCPCRGRAPGLARRCVDTSCASSSVPTTAGTAFRAYQPAVGREVAIKVIRPDLANDPAFIRRFQAEAQVVATLEHPHIVPLYDYWREPDAAYLVMRLMRGGSLAIRPRARRAHARPDDDDGRSTRQRAADRAPRRASSTATSSRTTSCSTTTATRTCRTSGSRSVMPRCRPSSDIYGLGVLVAEALTGRPSGLDELRGHCRIRLPASSTGRPASMPAAATRDVGDLVTDLHEALSGRHHGVTRRRRSSTRPSTIRTRACAPFDAVDAVDFFGRERLVERLIARLGRQRHPRALHRRGRSERQRQVERGEGRAASRDPAWRGSAVGFVVHDRDDPGAHIRSSSSRKRCSASPSIRRRRCSSSSPATKACSVRSTACCPTTARNCCC